jgi:hypothetical protein
VADELMTCANCGHTQATGAFCETCGTKLAPAAAAPAAAPAPEPAPAPAAATFPPPAPMPVFVPAPQVNYGDITGKGFWGRFFDFSFREFITPSVIKVLFIVMMVVIGLTMLGIIVQGFMWSAGTGVVALIGAIIWGFVALLFSRVFLELIMVFFNIHDDTRKMANKK